MENDEFNKLVRLRLEAQMKGVEAVLNQQANVWRDTPDAVAAIRSVAEALGIKLQVYSYL